MGSPPKSSPSRRRSTLRSGLYTGLSSLVLTGSGAAAGVVLAREFGRNAVTDGFLAAYGVYLVLTLGAQAFRLVIVPDLTRAAAEDRLAAETRAYAAAFLLLGVALTVLVVVLAPQLGEAITGSLPGRSASVAGSALQWLVPAAFAQLLAALCASALAAIDSYASAAVGFAAGGIAGVVVFVALESHGLIALGWGLAVGGAIALALPALALAVRVPLLVGSARLRIRTRVSRLVVGAAVPLALQGLYVVALRLAAGVGVGQVTSLSYAYVVAGALVTATALALSLVATAPLTRRGIGPERAAEHVVHASWVSLALVGAAAGVFALVGGRIVAAVLGGAYGGHVGREVGRLVVDFSPWMVAFAAFAATYPLLFVMESARVLVPIAVAAIAVDVPIGIGLRSAFGIHGIAIGMGVVVFLVLAALAASVSRTMLARIGVGLARLSVVVGGAAAVAYGVADLLLGAVAAAVVGTVAYACLLAGASRFGLRDAWRYVRSLHDQSLTEP